MVPAEPCASPEEGEIFTRVHAAEDRFPRRRLVAFVGLHLLAFLSEVATIINFAVTGDTWFFSLLFLPFLFSGAFCAHAAWHCDAPSTGSILPLKNRLLPTALLMLVPLGFFQGVIVQLAFEEFFSRKREAQDGAMGARPSMSSARPTSNKFHCKAVNGLFEGLPSSALILYAYWTMDYPKRDPITSLKWPLEGYFLAVAGSISFLSSGLGLLELDFCTSKAVSKHMRRCTFYEFKHWLFRTSEVASRVFLFINFMVVMRCHVAWWWVPLAVDFGLTFLLVLIFGGVETTWMVRPLCSIPCVFANIFLFVDSPIKRRAARRISTCLTIKHAVELLVLPILARLSISNFKEEVEANWEMHGAMNVATLVTIVMYWVLLWWLTASGGQQHDHCAVDIFSACEGGSVATVRSAIRELTNSAAVGLNVNIYDIDGNTPLSFAAANGHAEVCKRLVQEGARVDVRMFGDRRPVRNFLYLQVRRRWTALHIAAQNGHADVVQVLLQAARSRAGQERSLEDFLDTVSETPLHVAARAGHTEVARLLANAQPDWVDERNSSGQTPADVAGSEEVREAIQLAVAQLDSIVAPGSRHSPVLPRMEDQWPQVELSIVKSSRDISLMAPGLSSYIASSCGGALGRIFLAEVAAGGELRQMSRLTSITEAGESLAGSLILDTSTVIVPVVQSVEQHPPLTPELTMSDLEPINARGQPVAMCLAVLGEGSYGLVWRAQDRKSGQWYAVKNIRTQRGSTSVATRECDVADFIRIRPHPCLVTLHLVHNFADAGLYALVMEFCPGGDVLDRIRAARDAGRKRASYEPPSQSLRWIGQVFLGLEHMHCRMDTLLRDLKPENVVLTADGRTKLTDFGFGRFGVEAPGRWSFGIPSGSPGYVAPEILMMEKYDERVDLYSLGVLTWVLLTGGVTNLQDPQPPMGRMRHGKDFQAHYQDHKLLAACVKQPERNYARPLGSDERDFVLHLIDRRPEARMKHPQIRRHRMLQGLSLPVYDAPRSVVDTWCSAPAEKEEQ